MKKIYIIDKLTLKVYYREMSEEVRGNITKYTYPNYDGFGSLLSYTLGDDAFLTEQECKSRWEHLKGLKMAEYYAKITVLESLKFNI